MQNNKIKIKLQLHWFRICRALQIKSSEIGGILAITKKNPMMHSEVNVPALL